MRKKAKIFLKKFELSDLPEILKIEREAFPKDPWPEKNFRFCYKRQPDGLVVAILNGKLVGFAVGWISKKWGGIGDMVVAKRYRKRGIGSLLVNHILEWLKQKKSSVCRIEVRVDNQEALGFFQKLGFKKIKKLSNFYPNGEDAYLLIRGIP